MPSRPRAKMGGGECGYESTVEQSDKEMAVVARLIVKQVAQMTVSFSHGTALWRMKLHTRPPLH